MNTHDTPTFAGFLAGRDIDERVARGALDADRAGREHCRRQEDVAALRGALGQGPHAATHDGADRLAADLDLLWACLEHLARSVAGVVIVNLEDLWLEPRPQNVPGTGARKHPNWRRRARYELETLTTLPGVAESLRRIARARVSPERREPDV